MIHIHPNHLAKRKRVRRYTKKFILDQSWVTNELSDCGLHTLRHTLASKMVKNGFSLYEVQSILGHTSPTTTTRYSHLESASISKKVAEKLFAK